MEILNSSSVAQFAHGFKLLVPFDDTRVNAGAAPVHDAGLPDTWEVRIVKPNGTALSKTANLEFPDVNMAEIAFPVDPLDLDVAGTYYYQVIRTTGTAEIGSGVKSFDVEAALPDSLPMTPPTSPSENFFPIYDSQSGLATSLLQVDGGVLKFNGSPVSGGSFDPNRIVYGETPSGLINGSNATFTTSVNFIPALVEVFLNGIRQTEGAGNDYTTSGNDTINMLVSPETGSILRVNYVKL